MDEKIDEKSVNPFDDSNVMPSVEEPEEAVADVEQEDLTRTITQTSQLEPPGMGLSKTASFPARMRSPARQAEIEANTASTISEPPANRIRGGTLSSVRHSVDRTEMLDSIHEERPLGRPPPPPESVRAPSLRASSMRDSSGMRDRTASIASRRRNRGFTLGRVPSLFRRPTLVSSGVSSSIHGSGNGDTPGGGFTLAGQDSTQAAQNQPFVDPAYAALNPAYVQPTNNRPVWGLAKPLPRVLRPGMVPAPSELNITKPDNESQTSAYPADIDDVERGQPSLRRASTFQTSNLRDQRETKLLQRQGTHAASEVSRTSIDEQSNNNRFTTNSEPFPNMALPTPIPEGREEEDGGDYFGQVQSHSYSYVPSATRKNANKFNSEGRSDTSDVEHEDEWPGFLPYDVKMGHPEDEVHNHHTHWSVIRTRYREPLAEFTASLVQLTIAFCADLSITVSDNPNNFSASFAWGFASMTGIYIAGGISGAHLNPAISIMLYVYRGFPLRKVPTYMFAQIFAAFVAGLISYGLYRTAIIEYSAGLSLSAGGTASAFITSPRHSTVDHATAFFNEFVATAFLAVVVLALGDDSNAPPGAGMSALVLGLVITVLCMAFGYNTGAAMNPSRDFGPRLALWAVGYGGDALWNNGYWVYAPWAATIAGAVVGGGLYDVAIFVGGESPVNYPRKRMWRAGHKWKKRMHKRIRREEIPDTLR